MRSQMNLLEPGDGESGPMGRSELLLWTLELAGLECDTCGRG